jgi:RND family efflux transporter MFP subunit
LAASRERLKNFDMSEYQIQQLEKDGVFKRTVQVISPFDGIVDYKHVEVGMGVKPNMKLYSISNLDQIWVVADIYENDVPLIKPGLAVEMELVNQPEEQLIGVVDYVYPYLNEKNHTLQVRLVFPNQNQLLKPGMYANVFIETDPINDALVVPSEAVIFSGIDNLVFIDNGDGHFSSQLVVIGVESHDGYYEVIEGLEEGEVVVTSAQFLLDSESKLQKNIYEMTPKMDHSNHNH